MSDKVYGLIMMLCGGAIYIAGAVSFYREMSGSWSTEGGQASVRTNGAKIEIKLISSDGRWHAANFAAPEARDLILGIGKKLDELPDGKR